MAFVDELKVFIKAGAGGDGVVRWLHEKHKEFGGPSGGDGGRGGNVYVLAVRDAGLLAKYKNVKKFSAERGQDGANRSFHGANGRDLEITLPIGAVILNKKTGEKILLEREGERVLLLKGGAGGRGNEFFKSSTNQRPKEFTRGTPGEEAEFFIEVELIADIGLIGLPNAGKTSMLNQMTNAKAKVGNYPFTTLEPNLGEAHGYIIADIPGLIEGAAEGKGLGDTFLKHVRKTKLLVHLISVENKDPAGAYRTVRRELEKFDPELAKKKEIAVLTKTDLIEDRNALDAMIKELKKQKVPIAAAVEIPDDSQIKRFRDMLIKEIASLSG